MIRICAVKRTVAAAASTISRHRQFAKHEARHENRIDAGDRGGFGRREHAAIDAAEDDDRRAERPQAAHRRAQEALEIERLAGAEIAVPRAPDHIARDQSGDQQAGQDAGRIEPRHRFLRRRAIDDHRDARRDDDVDGADRGDQAGGERLRIAGLDASPDTSPCRWSRPRPRSTPEIAPKIVAVPTVVTPRLPRTEPTPPWTKSTSRCATLPRPISSPA